MQVQKELEEERRQAEEQQRLAQEAIQAKVAELRAIEAARRQEVMACPTHCPTNSADWLSRGKQNKAACCQHGAFARQTHII